MSTLTVLEDAIRQRQQVVAWYGGARRAFCPHALGTKGQKRHVLAYQFSGGSASGLPEDGEWRCFEVAKLLRAKAQAGPWFTAPNLFNPQSCLDEIDLVVQPLPSAVSAQPRPAGTVPGREDAPDR